MAMTWALTGKAKILGQATNNVAVSSWKLHLYTNNETPDKDSVYGDFTEDTADGYAAETMTPASWTIAAVGATAEMKGSYPKVTFTYTEASTVYGYYITDTAGTCLIGAEKFSDGPYTLGNSGGSINTTLSASIL